MLISKCVNVKELTCVPRAVCVCVSSGARVHGDDEPTDDHSSADATDPVPPSAPGPAAATAGFNATAGKTHTHINTHTNTHSLG